MMPREMERKEIKQAIIKKYNFFSKPDAKHSGETIEEFRKRGGKIKVMDLDGKLLETR